MLEFKLPEVGENIKSGTVVKINVAVGAGIKKGQTLLELETDKASIEVPSPTDGVIKEILIKQGQEVKIGALVMKIEAGAVATGTTAPTAAPQKVESKAAAPAGNGPKAAVTHETAALPTAPAAAKPAPAVAVQSAAAPIKAQKEVPAAPSVRRFAREIGIDVSQVPGTGPGGRISLDDVKNFAKQATSGGGAGGGIGMAARALPDFNKFGEVERKPMSNVRKKTAEHLSYAWQSIPHVTQFDKADITELEKLRKRFSTDKRKLTITPFLLKVLASAMKSFPQFNSSIDMASNEIIYKKYINIGVAVDTERGLLVPVLRNVDQKSIFQLADELTEIAQRARDKKTTLEEMTGGSMTVTNLGGIGGVFFTPIVNWPEVAILGVSRGSLEPVYENGQFIPRLKLPLSLSYDHRVIDGADGARFIRWVVEAIEQPFMMELEK